MIELAHEVSECQLAHVVNGHAHADFFVNEGVCLEVVVVEIKQIIIIVFTKTDMVRSMSKNTLVLMRDVDTSLPAVDLDLIEPLVA